MAKKMKEKTTYVCEVCGTEYTTKKECISCEENHASFAIIDSIYNLPWWRFIGNKKYPIALKARTADGNEYLYELTRINGRRIS